MTISGTNIPETTGHEMAVQFPISPNICFYTLPGENRTDKILHFIQGSIITFLKITRVDHIWFTFRSLWLTVYPNVPYFCSTATVNVGNVGPLRRLREQKQADGFSNLHALIVVSIMFCSRPIQISTSRVLSSSTFLNVV